MTPEIQQNWTARGSDCLCHDQEGGNLEGAMEILSYSTQHHSYEPETRKLGLGGHHHCNLLSIPIKKWMDTELSGLPQLPLVIKKQKKTKKKKKKPTKLNKKKPLCTHNLSCQQKIVRNTRKKSSFSIPSSKSHSRGIYMLETGFHPEHRQCRFLFIVLKLSSLCKIKRVLQM